MNSPFFSVRMRASDGGRHLSGAERLVAEAEVDKVISDLTRRALSTAGDGAVEIRCSVDKVNTSDIRFERLPDLQPYQVPDYNSGRDLALCLLEEAGVSGTVARMAMNLLIEGPGHTSRVMRGAVIMDVASGARLETDSDRGVRASRMDLTEDCRSQLTRQLQEAGLGHRRVVEALVLAGKVLAAPGMVAELCWSDDPQYTAGYVASPAHGYQRISTLKAAGNPVGGRIFFVDTNKTTVSGFVDYLEKQPVLFDRIGSVHSIINKGSCHG